MRGLTRSVHFELQGANGSVVYSNDLGVLGNKLLPQANCLVNKIDNNKNKEGLFRKAKFSLHIHALGGILNEFQSLQMFIRSRFIYSLTQPAKSSNFTQTICLHH